MIQTNTRRPTRPSRKRSNRQQQHGAQEARGATSWIFCIINYLWVATSCYLHWTDGNAVWSSNAMQGPAGIAGWRVQRGGEGMCECVKYCTETPPAAANVAPGKKGELGATLGGQRNAAGCSAYSRVLCRMAHFNYIMYKSKPYHKPRGTFSWPGLSLAFNHKSWLRHHLQ